jgi:cysteine-rich repeat protein
MPSAHASTSLLLALLAAACRPDCPDGVTDRRGYQCTPVPGDTSTGDESTSTGDSSSSTADTSSSSSDSSTSSDASSSTGTPPPCDDDPACGEGEDVNTCPEQCNLCGDSVVFGAEACDNGTNQDAPYSPTPPPPDACAPACLPVEFCGDSVQNGPEPCDAAGLQTATCEADCRSPACGDGTLNTLAAEACDDANMTDGDGCSAACLPERRVFASSSLFFGDLNFADDNPDMLAGIPLADARCNALAAAAGISGSFKAWLSDSDSSPADRFDTAFSGLYRLLSPDFPIVASGWPDLTDGALSHPIDADEKGALTQENVLTNTAPDGASASDLHCSAWTANDNTTTTFGQSSALDATWTEAVAGACSFSGRLYCFEDP